MWFKDAFLLISLLSAIKSSSVDALDAIPTPTSSPTPPNPTTSPRPNPTTLYPTVDATPALSFTTSPTVDATPALSFTTSPTPRVFTTSPTPRVFTTSPTPALSFTTSPTPRVCPRKEDVCEDMGDSVIYEISEGIKALEDELATNEGSLTAAEKKQVVEMICSLQIAKAGLIESIDKVCITDDLDSRRLADGCAGRDYTAETNAALIVILALSNVLWLAEGAVATADGSSIPLVSGVAAATASTAVVIAQQLLFAAVEVRNDLDGRQGSCTLQIAAATQDAVNASNEALSEVKSGVDGVQSGVDNVQAGVEAVQAGVEAVQEGVEAVQEGVDNVQEGVDNVQAGVDAVKEVVDNVKENVDEIEEFVKFLACPFTDDQQENTIFIGQGCDGKDNNCNSVIGMDPAQKRVDECAEDQVPPTISLRNDIPILGFKSAPEAEDWFASNIDTSDDCVSNLELTIGDATEYNGEPGADSRLYEIEVRVFDPICANERGEKGAFETVQTFIFIVDNVAPQIECGFDTPQDWFHVLDPDFVPDCDNDPPFPGGGRDDPLHINNDSPLVNVKFWYQVTDEAPGDRKIPVNISVLSNEFEHSGRDMVKTIKMRDLGEMGAVDQVHRAKVFLAPYTCHDGISNSLICELEMVGNPELNTRFYDIEITATDEIGNEGISTCSVVVIPEQHMHSKSSKATHCTSKSGKSSTIAPKAPTGYLQGNHLLKGAKVVEHGASKDRKSGKGVLLEHNPTDLHEEFMVSTQRYQIAKMELEWDTSLATVRDPPMPPPRPLFGKSGKSSSKSSRMKGEADENMVYLG